MEKQLELNFNINEETINGHKYNKKNFLKQFSILVKSKKLFVYPNSDNCNDATKAIGFVKFYIEKDGIIEVGINLTNPDLYDTITEESKVTSAGIGLLENSIVKNFKLTHLFLTEDKQGV